VDAPGPCAIVFCRGCNLQCKYCYNVDLFNTNKGLDLNNIIEKIKNIKEINPKGEQYNTVQWLILSGGEPFSQKVNDSTMNLLVIAKRQGLKTGIYTNGLEYDFQQAIDENLLDFVNLDFKHWNTSFNLDKNINYINRWLHAATTAYEAYMHSKLEYLYFNTVVCKTIHSKDDLIKMYDLLKKRFETKFENLPILEKKFEEKFGWVLTPFYNDYGKLPTLGNLDYEKEKMFYNEIKQLLI
jgi:pyruvate-formate lyase-activating enzyme